MRTQLNGGVLALLLILSACSGGSSDDTAPSSSPIELTVRAPATTFLSQRIVLEASATGATAAEAATIAWRQISGPGEVWLAATTSGGAVAEFARSGTYVVEASITAASGTVTRREASLIVSAPDTLQTRLEGELPIRSNQAGHVGPRILTEGGDIYVAYVDTDLRTVVAKRRLGVSGDWEISTVATGTADEPNHNKPAIGIDRDGYIHVVYDMHGDPWKYKISTRPRDVTAWTDRSADLTTQQSAFLPGQQITYPFMARSPDGDLWLSFRECTDCRNSDFFARGWSSGLVKYNMSSRLWERPAGGAGTFAQGGTYRPQYLRVWFDAEGTMSLAWVWGLQYTQPRGSDPYFMEPNYPSYVRMLDGQTTFRFANGNAATLPLTFASSDRVISPSVIDPALGTQTGGYFGHVDDVSLNSAGNPVVTTRYRAVRYSPSGWSQQWDGGNAVPFSGSIYRYTQTGDLIAVSAVDNGLRGITVHRSRNDGASWTRFQVDASTTDNALSNPVYFLDEDHFLKTGGETIRVALAYTRATSVQPVMRVFTINLPR